jgi:Kdo2-lipid IVA lauroyltransferase/acyltransferase
MGKRKRKLPEWLHQPAYLTVRSLIALATLPGVNISARAARELGRAYASLPMARKRLARAEEHIAVAFPDMPKEERAAHAREAFEHLFMLAIETACAGRLLTRDNWAECVRVTRLDRSLSILLSGRPVMLITGHCGNWELLGSVMALLGFPLHALYRPLDLKPMDDWVRATRQARGMVLLDKFGAARAMPKLVAEGAPVSFIADQNAGDRGMFVPFFNRLASTYKSIGLMAIRYDAPVVCGQARRLVHRRDADRAAPTSEQWRSAVAGESSARTKPSVMGEVGFADYSGEEFRYQIEVTDIIEPEDWKGRPDPLFYVTARYRRALEEMVRRAPEQNLWLHRYWKSRPRHERLGKPFPESLREKLRELPWMTEADLATIEEHSARDAAAIASVPA